MPLSVKAYIFFFSFSSHNCFLLSYLIIIKFFLKNNISHCSLLFSYSYHHAQDLYIYFFQMIKKKTIKKEAINQMRMK